MLTINKDELHALLNDAMSFHFKPESEKAIKELLAAQIQINATVDELKSILKEKALEHDETTRTIEGDEVKVSFSPSGSKYIATDLQAVKPELLEIKLNTKAVEFYVKETSRLPEGVMEKERGLSVRITLKDGNEPD